LDRIATIGRRKYLFMIFIIALALRSSICIFVADVNNPVMYEHGAIAHNLYHGYGFSMHWPYTPLDPARSAILTQPPTFEGAFLPPINPYIIYAAYVVFGETSAAIVALLIINILISSLVPLATYRLAYLISSKRGAIFASLISVFFLPAAFAVTTFSGSPFYQLLGVIILYYAIFAARQPSFKSFILLGVSCGVMTLLRSEFFILGFVMIITSLFLARKQLHGKALFLQGGASLLLCAVIIFPWTYRNYLAFNKFVPVLSHPWYEMWRGNNIYATGTTLDETGRSIWVDAQKYPDLIRRMDAIPYNQSFETNVDEIFKGEVITFIEENPVRFLLLGLKKVSFLFTIDFNHPASRNPLYFVPTVTASVLILMGLFKLFQNTNQTGNQALMIFLIFLLCYVALTLITVMLPRYQIYILSTLLPLVGILPMKRLEQSQLGAINLSDNV
jgi:4-amino-4-deoxy-L-arabinose transferase-like glycosyltransferase